MGNKRNQNKIILPPKLPEDIGDDEVEISDEDIDFIKENRAYAGFLKNLDTKLITRHVNRVANVEDDALESLYEKRNRKACLQKEEDDSLKVHPADVLPVKSLDGELYYRTDSQCKTLGDVPMEEDAANAENDIEDKTLMKLTKAERREKWKKSRKEAKKPPEDAGFSSFKENMRLEALEEVKMELSAEEVFQKKRIRVAELGLALRADPEENIKSLRELLQMCNDKDPNIVKIALLSLLVIFKDIIPGYRIRLPTEKELQMTVSVVVKKMRFYESSLLGSYKAYLQKLINLQKLSSFKHITVRCLCDLLDAVPHFNFRKTLITSVVQSLSSQDETIRRNCCLALKSVFVNEGKHGGEATVEAVQMIAYLVKEYNCHLHTDCIEVLLSLSFDEDLEKEPMKADSTGKHYRKRRQENGPIKISKSERNGNKLELRAKIREEVMADFKSTSFVLDKKDRRKMQSEILSFVFQTYFRILKHSMSPSIALGSKVIADSLPSGIGGHPLLAPCLKGLGKFSHLIDLDFMGDLMNALRQLADGKVSQGDSLTISERLQCCIVSFKVMKSNLDALNIDLNDFFIQLYNLLLEYNPEREHQGEVLAEALKIMLCEGKQHDIQRASAFIKRLATFSLCFGSAEAMAALVTLKHLLQMHAKCRILLENDAGGGSFSRSVAKYQADASDPNLSGALASVLWELTLLVSHYNPLVSSMASSISNMNTSHDQVYPRVACPQQAFSELLIREELFHVCNMHEVSDYERKHAQKAHTLSSGIKQCAEYQADEGQVRIKFSEHFLVLKNIAKNERLRTELDQTLSSVKLYREYKKQERQVPSPHLIKKQC